MYRWIPALLLLVVAPACQADPIRRPSHVMAQWTDIPLPRGFAVVDAVGAEVPVTAGEYRAGQFMVEGRGLLADVGTYYQERLPQHGWAWDPAGNAWRKGDSLLEVDLTAYDQKSYANEFGLVRYQLRVRSQRTSIGQQ